MPAQMPTRRFDQPLRGALLVGFAGLALVFSGVGAPAAGAASARYEGSSVDGGIVFFSTAEPMVTGDTDSFEDVFERSKDAGAGGEYVTREVSIGPTGGNDAYNAFYKGSSANGQRVVFATKESLVPQDTDQAFDVYMRDVEENATTLVSQGDASCTGGTCGNGPADSSVVPGGVIADGNRVFFATTEKLASGDDDGGYSDIYMRDVGAGSTILVSDADPSCTGEGCGGGALPATFDGASDDGTKAFFASMEKLTAGDGDGLTDIYARDISEGSTALVTSAGTCPTGLPPDQNCDPVFGGNSNDGSHVFFETRERIAAGDEDSSSDVYDWSGGTASLVSTGPDGGNGSPNAIFAGNSASGATVYFATDEALDSGADGDSAQDVYKRSGGTTTLVSTGPEGGNGNYPATFKWVSPNGSSAAVIFTTAEALVAADEDESQDVYERSGGTTTLLSTGPDGGNGAVNASFSAASNDGSRVFFGTTEPLVSEDEDASADIYQRSGSATTRISIGALNGNGPFSAGLRGLSADGTHAFFTTAERLAEGDLDAEEEDVYQRTSGGTLLVSTVNAKPLGPAPPSQLSTNPASPGESLTPSIHGQADEGTAIKIYTTSGCSGEPVATGTGEELATSGIPVTVSVGSTTTFRATAEAEGIVSVCSNSVTYKQEYPAPPPPPGETGEETGEGGSGSNGSTGKNGSGGKRGVSYETPETRITFGPSFKTRKRKLAFRFTDATEQPGTSFFCKLDHRGWQGCSSPKQLKGLSLGKHVFRVKARNAVGDWDDSPTKRSFKVVGPRG